jgi:coatomer protein complex subunit alpha (xenin)
MVAKAHGLEDECNLILEASGLTEDQITLPTLGKPLDLPRIIVSTHKENWPVKSGSHTFFEKALLGEVGALDESTASGTSAPDAADPLAVDEAAQQNGHGTLEDEDEAEGWDIGDDINVEVEADTVDLETAEVGPASSEADLWARNSPIAADHVAAGSFETAMQLLNRQVGAVNFEPLKPRFLEIYQGSKTYLPASAGLPPLVNYVRRTVEETDLRNVLPIIPRDLETIASVDLQEGYSAMRANKLDDGLKIFKRILQSLLVNAVSSQQQVSEAKKIISSASEYATAMAMELERRSIGTDGEANLKRSLELSAYFTIPKLEVAHRQLALMAAMKLAATNKNFSSALSFANRMIANGGTPKLLEQVSYMILLSVSRYACAHGS